MNDYTPSQRLVLVTLLGLRPGGVSMETLYRRLGWRSWRERDKRKMQRTIAQLEEMDEIGIERSGDRIVLRVVAL